MALDPGTVSAVLVTRGNVPLDQITTAIRDAGVTDIVVWDNSQRENLSCYGRYAGILEARNPYIFHQDDDLVAPVGLILNAYDPVRDRGTVVANNRADERWRLTAMGAVFHRDLAGCLTRYVARYGDGPDFHRVSDVAFAYQLPYRRVVFGYEDLPWASDPGSSMHLEDGHDATREQARARAAVLTREARYP